MPAAGVVSQSFDAKTLTYSDNSTGIGTVVSRSLSIYDANGTLLITIPMSDTTATYAISKDLYLTFVETITLSVGSPVTVTVAYYSNQFYKLAQVQLAVAGCDCCGNVLCSDETKARELINAADTDFNIGDGVSCQDKLDAAYALIS